MWSVLKFTFSLITLYFGFGFVISVFWVDGRQDDNDDHDDGPDNEGSSDGSDGSDSSDDSDGGDGQESDNDSDGGDEWSDSSSIEAAFEAARIYSQVG